MPYCSVITCRNHSWTTNLSNSGVSYHKFPNEPDVKKRWINATGRYNLNWFPQKTSTNCSTHFEDHIYQPGKNRRLPNGAIPTINLPSTSQDVQVKEITITTNSTVTDATLENKLPKSPRKRKLRASLDRATNIIKRQKLTIKRIRETNRRASKKITVLQKILNYLKNIYHLEDEEISVLKSTNIKTDHLKVNKKIKKVGQYFPEIRSFALTLHFCSPKAYDFVRGKFNTCLPHPRTLKKWYSNVDAKVGFTVESFKALKCKGDLSKHKIVCNLVVDEMAIRKRVEWDGKRFHGYVDIGTDINTDTLKEAKEALVFLVNAINGDWKVPVGYFLVDGVNGKQRANLIRLCLELIHETGVKIVSVTCDGCPANLSMLRKLGCSFNIHKLKPYFAHPTTQNNTYVFLDACHMLKLIRNAFQFYKIFIDRDERPIKWEYLEKLHNLQEKEHLHLGNRLGMQHINFENNKMKVKLASQLFSNSVADAIIFCETELEIHDFKNASDTTFFLRRINNLFDSLNSKNIRQFDFKKPLHSCNKSEILKFFEETKLYLKTLMLPDGRQIVNSERKTGFVGFIVCMESAQALYTDLVENHSILKYLPMYKFSQDHIELLFYNIRSHGGSNNNPTARQFLSIYKKILTYMELKDTGKGNGIRLEKISILNCSSAVQKINKATDEQRMNEDNDDNHDDINAESTDDEEFNMEILSQYTQQIVAYIAGFVVRHLSKKLKCPTRISAIFGHDFNSHRFLNIRDKEGIVHPSESVIMACKRVETVIKTRLMLNNKIISKDTKQFIMTKALKLCLGLDIFQIMHSHQFDQEPLNNHVIDLTRAIMEKYIDIRLYYLSKRIDKKPSLRHLYNKQVLFSGD